MNPTKKGFFIIMAVFVMLSLACNLGSITGGGAPTSNGGSSASGANQDEFSGGPSLPIIRKDKSSFNPSQFVASNLPVEVTFSGDLSADVVFKGALAEPNYNVSATPPKKLNLFVVLQKDVPSVLYQDGADIKADKWVMDWQVEMLDSSGTALSKVEYKRFATLYANYPQSFTAYLEKIPENTSTARVTISMIDERLPLSCITPDPKYFCATPADLGFKIPSPFVLLTPVQISLKMGTWNETYKKNAVLGEFTFIYKNPLKKTMDYHTTLLFLDDSGSLVGYFEDYHILDPNETYNRNQYGDYYQCSYFSAIPTKTLVYTTAKIQDLIEAAR